MTLRRAIGLSVGGVMVLLGALWTGQGLALIIVVVSNARRDRGRTDLDDRYGRR